MDISKNRSLFSRALVIAAVAFALIGASTFSFAGTASADNSSFVTIKGVPAISFINAKPELVNINGHVHVGNPLKLFTVIVDKGTANQRTYVFKPDGTITHSDVGLISVDCDTKVSTNGYIIGPARINCTLQLDKTKFSAGAHNLHVDALQTIGTLSADGSFTLRPNVPHIADLVDKTFLSPTSVKQASLRYTWVVDQNQGGAAAGGHFVTVYLSSTPTVTGSSTDVGHTYVPALGVGQSKVLLIQVIVPVAYPLGATNFVSFVDSQNNVVEITKSNNQLHNAVTVIP
jgi:hypothetical protein